MRKSKTQWERSIPDFKAIPRKEEDKIIVDRENKIVYGVNVITENVEALGHGVWINAEFVDKVVELGNAKKNGVKVRYGHPSMSASAMGTNVGKARNFRIANREIEDDNGKRIERAVIADYHLFNAKEDDAKQIMDIAENSPEDMGTSIVFRAGVSFKEDKNKRKRYEPIIDDYEDYEKYEEDYDKWIEIDSKIFAVIEKLNASDFVDEPAANPSGLFSTKESFAALATEFLESNPQITDLIRENPEVVKSFFERYDLVYNGNNSEYNKKENNMNFEEKYNSIIEEFNAYKAANEVTLSEINLKVEALEEANSRFSADNEALRESLASYEAEKIENAKSLAQEKYDALLEGIKESYPEDAYNKIKAYNDLIFNKVEDGNYDEFLLGLDAFSAVKRESNIIREPITKPSFSAKRDPSARKPREITGFKG